MNSAAVTGLFLGLAWLAPLALVEGSSIQGCSVQPSYRWPIANKGLVAPVTASYDVLPYVNPLIAERTESSILIKVPPDFHASFNISGGPQSEEYELSSIELRRPGREAQGTKQVMVSVLEVVLLHREVSGSGRWASIVVPMEENPDPVQDFLTPLIAGAHLPNELGQAVPVMRPEKSSFDLSLIWSNTSFLTFWLTLPCKATTVYARQLMRNSTLQTVPSTVAKILSALAWAPAQAPAVPPSVAWILNACQLGAACKPQAAADVQADLLKAQTTQSQLLQQMRNQKALMDQALLQLKNGSAGAYQNAVETRQNLRAAVAALDGATATVNVKQALSNQVTNSTWDSGAPPPASNASASTTMKAGLLDISEDSRNGRSESFQDSLSLLRASHCRSEAADTGKAHAAAFASGSALRFGRSQAKQLRAINNGDHLRLMAIPEGQSLMTVSISDTELAISYIDIKLPGEHSGADTEPSPVELQLVHLPAPGAVSDRAVAVALLLDEGRKNEWLQPLVLRAPEVYQQLDLRAGDLSLLHRALGRGVAGHYYRFEGALPRTPCSKATWYILEEKGHIGRRQLEALRAALLAVEADTPRSDRIDGDGLETARLRR